MTILEQQPRSEVYQPIARHFDILDPFAFVKDVRTETHRAEKYVLAKAMHAELGHATGPFLDLLVKTAKRGVYTRLDLDDYSQSLTDAQFNLAIPFIKDPNEKAYRQFRKQMNNKFKQELRQKGIDVRYHKAPLGLGKLLPFFGCDHVKALVIDEDVAYVGGMNFSDANFLCIDLMIKIKDKHMVEVLTELIESPLSKDMSYVFSDGTQFFVDSGSLGKSKVLDADMHALNNTKESFYVSSGFLPDGRFLKGLEYALRRGVDVRVFAKPSEKKGFNPYRSFLQRTHGQIIKKGIPLFAPNEQVHAKAFVADKKIARIGSHNFTSTTQWAQTREFSLQTRSQHVVNQLLTFFQELEAESQPLS